MRATQVGFLILLIAGLGQSAAGDDTAQDATVQRQSEVAQRGAQVMPFSLSSTTHIFTKTESGGLQQVIARNPQDTDQIAMIRTHLSKIADQFRHGDFSGPTETHGPRMPGLAKLKAAKPGQISVRYGELPNGAQIEYSTKSETLVAALHDWFDAQLSDHGADAMAGHDQTMHH